MKPRLLDLFCGAGGCSVGYARAGFEVVGVDAKPMPRYPYEFHQADALEYLAAHGHEFDAIHASPPCQAHSSLKSMPNAKHHDDLIAPTRDLLKKSGKPYVIENVMGAPLIHPVMLCGTMFGLGVKDARAELRRHRIFETSWFFLNPLQCKHLQPIVCGVYGEHGRDRRRNVQVVGVYGGGGVHSSPPPRRPRTVGVFGGAGGYSIRDGVQQFSTDERREAMGIDWMDGKTLSQAIPPAYTEFIGNALREHLEATDGNSR